MTHRKTSRTLTWPSHHERRTNSILFGSGRQKLTDFLGQSSGHSLWSERCGFAQKRWKRCKPGKFEMSLILIEIWSPPFTMWYTFSVLGSEYSIVLNSQKRNKGDTTKLAIFKSDTKVTTCFSDVEPISILQLRCTWNPNDLYFWRSTPQCKAFSNQKKGHLGSRYIMEPIQILSLHRSTFGVSVHIFQPPVGQPII